MHALQRFESWFGQLLEAGLGGLLGARLHPVDIAKRLADHVEDRRRVGAGRTYVPNRYRVRLAPSTLAKLASFQEALEAELAAFVHAYAKEAGYHLVGRIRVDLSADASLRPERIRIESELVDRQGVALGTMDAGDQNTRPIAVAADSRQRIPELTLVVGRRRIPLPAEHGTSLGRALDNDVILDDPSVSRHHARLVPRPGHWLIEDLASAHGSFLNNQRVASARVRQGDQLRLGRLVIFLETPGAGSG